jgi:hypothetical protein
MYLLSSDATRSRIGGCLSLDPIEKFYELRFTVLVLIGADFAEAADVTRRSIIET